MTRTTIMLPVEVKRRAVAEARRLNVSFADFVRQAIAAKLSPSAKRGDRLKRRRQDPLFRLMDRLPRVETDSPSDLSANHDDYLYGDKSGSDSQ